MSELAPYDVIFTRRGVIRKYRPQDGVSLTVSGGATPSDTSLPVNVGDAASIALSTYHKHAESLSTNLETTVITGESRIDDFDTESYGAMALGANKKKTFPISPGPNYIKVKVENKDAANATKVTTILTVFSKN